jgi:hypothetical protein
LSLAAALDVSHFIEKKSCDCCPTYVLSLVTNFYVRNDHFMIFTYPIFIGTQSIKL